MRYRWCLVWLAACLLLPGEIAAQTTGTVTGRVTDPTGQPIAGAQVYLAGTQRGQLTNQEGRFLIANVPVGDYDVRATIIGYGEMTRRVSVSSGGTAVADFTLSQSAIELGAVIVTAVGQEQRKRELGNSIGSINVAATELAAVNSLSALLQARSPGVSVGSVSGTSGTAARIRIRGSNSVSLSNEPLVIVDGVRVNSSGFIIAGTGGQDASRLDDFSPENIESIEILKGPAAAALYGTAAANGVVQITTKRGRAGPARWSFYTEQGRLEDKTDYPSSYTAASNSGGSGPGRRCVVFDIAMGVCSDVPGLRSYNPLRDPDNPVFRTGSRSQYGMTVSGGGDLATYFLGLDIEGEEGVLRPSAITGTDPNDLSRINLRVNVNARPSDKLDLGLRTGYMTSDLTLPANDNHLLGIHLNGLLGSGDPDIRGGYYNIPSADQMLSNFLNQEARRFTTAANVNFRPLSWLSLTGSGGVDQVTRHDNQFMPPNVITNYTTTYRDGFRNSNRVENTILTATVNGAATFELLSDLISTSSLGGQYNREDYHDTRGGGVGIAAGTTSLSGASRLFTATENTIENATVGAFVQQQFAWRDRMFLTGAVRGDDNSAFGTQVGFVWYPSLSASWVVSEESYFPDVPLISSLRLRTAYGKSGLRPSFRDAITYYSPVTVRIQGAEASAVTLAGTGSSELRPETAREIEAGFDMGLVDDRFGIDITYYDKRSEDALIRRTLAPSLGLTATAFANVGSVSNKGWEAQLRANVVRTDNVDLELTLSGTTTKNRLEQLADDIPEVSVATGRNRMIHREGFPLGSYWQRRVTYADGNGDGLLQLAEVTLGDTLEYQGQPFPTREASLSAQLRLFDRFTLSGLLDYKGGHQHMNFTRFDRCSWEQLCEQTYVRESASLRDQAAWIAYNILEPNTNTSLYIEDGDFVKLRELSLSASLPQEWLDRTGFGMSAARLTLSGRNLKTWTDYRGIDPEINQGGIANFFTQEYYTQPPVRRYTLRVDVNF
jgi:TonB-dependent starch-binding outer membrane protein SusC